jgi:hypothetical protein
MKAAMPVSGKRILKKNDPAYLTERYEQPYGLNYNSRI